MPFPFALMGLGLAGLGAAKWGRGMIEEHFQRRLQQRQMEHIGNILGTAPEAPTDVSGAPMAGPPAPGTGLLADPYDPINQLVAAFQLQAMPGGRGAPALQNALMSGGGFGQEKFYGSTIPFQTEGGGVGYAQLGSRGTARPVQLPGPALTRQTPLNLGNQYLWQNPYMPGQPGPSLPMGVPPQMQPGFQYQQQAAQAGGRVAGQTQAEAAASLPQAEAEADRWISHIDKMLMHPALPRYFGATGMLPALPGSKTADFAAMAEQLQGGMFLQAREALRGQGTITDVESQRAEAAIGRLGRAQSDKAARESLRELQAIMRQGVARQRAAAGMGVTNPAQGAAQDLRSFTEQGPQVSPTQTEPAMMPAPSPPAALPPPQPAANPMDYILQREQGQSGGLVRWTPELQAELDRLRAEEAAEQERTQRARRGRNRPRRSANP